jgi:hypothetical protein
VIPDYVAQLSDSSAYNGQYSSSHISRMATVDDDSSPPSLPRQLEKPFLNQNTIQKEDQSVLPIPAHVDYDNNCS